jgi:hypothetical protein
MDAVADGRIAEALGACGSLLDERISAPDIPPSL